MSQGGAGRPTKPFVVRRLSELYAADNVIRPQAERFFEQYRMQEGFVPMFAQIISDRSVNVHTRAVGAVYLKNFIINTWDRFPFLKDRNILKGQFLNLMASVAPSEYHIMRVLCVALNRVVAVESGRYQVTGRRPTGPPVPGMGLEKPRPPTYMGDPKWLPALIQQVKGILASAIRPSPKLPLVVAAVHVVLSVVQLFQWADQDLTQRRALEQLSVAVLPPLLQLYAVLQQQDAKPPGAPGTIPVLTRLVLKYSLMKFLWRSMTKLGTVYDFMAAKTANFSRLVQLWVADLGRPPTTTKAHLIWEFKIRKWILTILRRIVTMYSMPSMGSRSVQDPLHVAFGKFFLRGPCVKLLEVILNTFLVRRPGQAPAPNKLLVMSMQYFQTTCLSVRAIFDRVVRPRLQGLMFGVVFGYCGFRQKEDLEDWRSDDAKYSSSNFDVPETFLSMHDTKAAACQTFRLLTMTYPKAMVPCIMKNIGSMLSSPRTPPPVLDGALYVFGNVAPKLIATVGDTLAPILVENVLKRFIGHSMPYLRAKACWVLGCFAGVNWRSEGNLVAAVRGIMSCFQDPEVIVRIRAANALTEFLQYSVVMRQVAASLSQVLKGIVELLQRTNDDSLVSALEIVIDAMKDRILPYAVNVMQKLVTSFLRFYNGYDKDEEGSFPAFAHLRAIVRLVEVVKPVPVIKAFGGILFPIVQRMLSEDSGEEFIEDLLMILTSMTFKLGQANQFNPKLWVFFPMIMKAYDTLGYSISHMWVPPIDNFVSYSNKIFMSDRRYMEMLLVWIRKIMLDPDKTLPQEKACVSAAEVVSVLLHHCRGKIDAVVPVLIDPLLSRLRLGIHSKGLCIIACDAFADFFTYNPQLAVRTIIAKRALQTVLRFWFDIVRKFHRRFDRRTSIFGFSSVIGAAATQTFPPEIMAALPKMLSAILFLIRGNAEQTRRERQPAPAKQQAEREILRQIQQGDGNHLEKSAHYKDFVREIFHLEDDEKDIVLEEDVCLDSPLMKKNEVDFFRAAVRQFILKRGKKMFDSVVFFKLSQPDQQLFRGMFAPQPGPPGPGGRPQQSNQT